MKLQIREFTFLTPKTFYQLKRCVSVMTNATCTWLLLKHICKECSINNSPKFVNKKIFAAAMLVIQWILFVPLNWGQLVSIYIPIDRNILSCYLRFHNSSSYNIQLMIHILNFTTIPKKQWLNDFVNWDRVGRPLYLEPYYLNTFSYNPRHLFSANWRITGNTYVSASVETIGYQSMAVNTPGWQCILIP